MALIDSSAIFSTSEAICLRDLLNPSINPQILQKLSVPFTNGTTKEHGQNFLNSLKLVRDMPKPVKGEMEVITQRKTQKMNKVV